MIHKRILDVARSNPDLSIEGIATDVSGASVNLVEKVLDQYGDPVEAELEPSEGDQKEPTSKQLATNADPRSVDDPDSATSPDQQYDPASMTEKQLETLQEIYRHPEATQADLAELLDVTSATICQRVNSIDGFDWSKREQFVQKVIEPSDARRVEVEPTNESESGYSDQIDELTRLVTTLEQRLESLAGPPRSIFADPELAHKVMHACMESDCISKEEELLIIREILAADAESGD